VMDKGNENISTFNYLSPWLKKKNLKYQSKKKEV
jgi:hypothetical protein